MNCANIQDCFELIDTYYRGERTGYPLLVNVECNDELQNIFGKLSADKSKRCIYVSDNCQPNGLPMKIEYIMDKVSGPESYILVGVSQAMMLCSQTAVEDVVAKLLSHPISGYAVVLLYNCRKHIQKFMAHDKKKQERVVLVDGTKSPLPRIKLMRNNVGIFDLPIFESVKELLYYLERLTDAQVKMLPSLFVITELSHEVFKDAVYAISEGEGIYEILAQKYLELANGTEYSYGNDKQWKRLAVQMQAYNDFSELICDVFGATTNLSLHLSTVLSLGDADKKWLLWLAMKMYGEPNNNYLTYVLNNSHNFNDFEEHIYCDLLDFDYDDLIYKKYYIERKILLENFPENLGMLDKFCGRSGKHQKAEVYYLTDLSEHERFEFIRCLSIYEYSEIEIKEVVQNNFPEISKYMKKFVFDRVNTTLSERDTLLHIALTDYFQEYKVQKLTNRIHSDFIKKVEQIAIDRPYCRLQARSSIVRQMDKSNSQLYFFDALGVEYLSYIQAKCEEYGLILELSIGHGELPSITEKNKDFLQFFPKESCLKISDLDQLKHHSQEFDFTKRPEPIHLFKELETIDNVLKHIRAQLVQETYRQAVIIGDHGASRLAVLFNEEDSSKLELEEKGKHSGRCCISKDDPQIPFAAYEDGYAIFANYKRFRGGRKANVEVHGGASLEEVLVPVITIAKHPDDLELCFVNPIIQLRVKESAQIVLYSNIPMKKPRLLVNGLYYEGVFEADNRHARFTMPELKRSKEYHAEVYEGDAKLPVTLSFRIQKITGTINDAFGV